MVAPVRSIVRRVVSLAVLGLACEDPPNAVTEESRSAPESPLRPSPMSVERAWSSVELPSPPTERPMLGWPVEAIHITSTFGWRIDPMIPGARQLHRGVDFRGDEGDLALSIGDGVVAFAGHDPVLGKLVVIEHGDAMISLYAHLSDTLAVEGVPVQRGAAIGLIGNTGRSSGPHLHLSIKVRGIPVDPLLLLDQPRHDPASLTVPRPTPTPDPPAVTP